jgi:hypothetical protein
MTEINNTVDTTTTEPTEEVDETKVDEATDEEAVSDIENKIDYEAERKELRDRVAKAEKASADIAFKLREEKRKASSGDHIDTPIDTDEDRPLTAREFQQLMAEERQATQKILQEGKIAELASAIASSPAEAELIKEIHKSRIFPSHLTIQEQVEESYIIANRKKILGENNELKRALRAKNNVSSNSATTHQDPIPSHEPKLSAGDKQALLGAGFTWNAISRRFEKKMSNGKTLVRDSKTGQTQLL